MADKLSINIDVEQAKAALKSLDAAFAAMSATATSSVSKASSAISRLNSALGAMKAIDGSVLTSVSALNQSLANLNAVSLSGLSASITELNAKASALSNLATNLNSVANSASGISQAAGAMNQAASAANGLGSAGNAARTSTDGLGRSAAQAHRSVVSLGTELLNSGGYMLGLGVSAGNVAARLSELQGTGLGVSGVLRELTSSFGALGTAAIVVAGAAAGFSLLYSAVSSVLQPIIEVGTAFNNFKIAIDAIDGNGAGAPTFEALIGVAQRTAQNLQTLSKTYLGFRAATESAGMSAAQSMRVFEQFNVGLRALGADSVKTEKAMLALTQMFSKGKVQAEELRGQLGDALPGALTYAAQSMKITTAELDALMKSGSLIATDLIPKLGEFLELKFGDAIAKQVASATGQIGLFQTAISLLQYSVSNGLMGGVLGGFAAGLASINNALNSDSLRAFASAVGDLAGVLLAALGGAIGGFIQGLTFIADVVTGAVSAVMNFITPLQLMAQYITQNNVAMGLVSGAFTALGAAVGGAVAAIAAYNVTLVAGKVATMAYTAVATLAAGATRLLTTSFQSFGGGWIAVITGVVSALGVLAPMLSSTLREMGGWRGVIGELTGATAQLATTTQVVARSMSAFTAEVSKAPASIMSAANSFFSLEEAQKRAKNEMDILDFKIKDVQDTMKQHADSVKDMENKGREHARGIQEEIQGLEAQRAALQSNTRFMKEFGVSTAGSKSQIADINETIRGLKESLQDSNIAMQDRVARENEYRDTLQNTSAAYEAQKQSLQTWGYALDSTGVSIARQLVLLGNSKEQAAATAQQYSFLVQSVEDYASALENEAKRLEAQSQLSTTMIQNLEAERTARVNKLREGGAEASIIAEVNKQYDSNISKLQTSVAENIKNAAALETVRRVHLGMGSAMELSTQVAEEFSKKFGVTVDPVETLNTATTKLADGLESTGTASKDAGAGADKLKKSAAGSGEQLRKAGQSAGTAATNIEKVGTVLSTTKEKFTEAQTSLDAISGALQGAGTGALNMSTNIPLASAAIASLAEVVPTVNAVLQPLSNYIGKIAKGATDVVTKLPEVSGALVEMGDAASPVAPPIKDIADSMGVISGAADGITKTKEAFATFLGAILESKDSLETATKNLSGLAAAAASIYGGFEKAVEGGDKFISALDRVDSAVGDTITRMDDLRKAAERAFAAIQKASGGNSEGGDGTATSSSQREGGYAGDRLETQRTDLSKFNDAPHFAEGTANTSRYLSKVAGGGIPSILHPNEAVIPLSRGRKIPVDLNIAAPTSSVLPPEYDARSDDMSLLARSIADLADATDGIAAMNAAPSMRDLTAVVPEYTVNVNVESPQYPEVTAPVIPPQARQTSDGLFGEKTPAADTTGGRSRDRSERESTQARTQVINFNVQTSDVDSFNRSKDQMHRDLRKKIDRANRRAKS